MSATNRGAPREENDKYYTPEWFAKEGIKVAQRFFPPNTKAKVLEPACGGGVLVSLLNEAFPKADITFADLVPDDDFKAPSVDFFDMKEEGEYDLILTNPPYKDAEAFATQALRLVKVGGKVVLLLRINFFGGQKRAGWQLSNPADECHVTVRRPKFKGKGSDACEYGWFVWTKGLRPEFTKTYMLDTRTDRYRD